MVWRNYSYIYPVVKKTGDQSTTYCFVAFVLPIFITMSAVV